MLVLMLILALGECQGMHFGEELSGLPGIIQSGNLLPQFGGAPGILYSPKIKSADNEIPRGQAFSQDVASSPYWSDGRSRPTNKIPDISPEYFTPDPDNCTKSTTTCDPASPYRTISGYCNNLLVPEYGSARQPMTRILPAHYDEGLMRVRSASGDMLPNPRYISLGIRKVPPRRMTNHNLMVMQMGQFIDHDFSIVPEKRGPGESKINCKDCSSWTNPACIPIPIPYDDPYFPKKTFQTGQPLCLPFTRSVGIGGRDNFGRVTIDPFNAITAFLDLSTVYGSDDCREKTLRTYNTGQLMEIKQSDIFLKGLPPIVNADKFDECRSREQKCFITGDDRTNEHMGMLIIHMVYLREHNRIAHLLSKINPHWIDERLFQEARRINIAQYQHVIYSQYLPILIGLQKMTDYRLNPEKTGYYQGYNDRVNPGVLTEFSTSAFRFGHTTIPSDFLFMDKNYLPQGSVSLVEYFHNISAAFQQGTCDSLLRGMIGKRLPGVDMRIESVVLEQLFEIPGQFNSGEDLIARNIARGRAHGIASYIQYRAACGVGATGSFNDLSKSMSPQAVDVLKKIYTNVEDIDLFIGGLAEDPTPGGLLGPTFACIIAFQFLNARRGDRFWYENTAAGFTSAQLHSIRSSATFARHLCDNFDHEPGEFCAKGKKDLKIPFDAFRIPSLSDNPFWSCDRIPSVDLNLWRENVVRDPIPCTYQGVVHQWQKLVKVSPCLTCICQSDGMLKCEPNLSGCGILDPDEHCLAFCDRNRIHTGHH
ncbi:hypothetical protein SK128_027034 [Halocaridina rubra]|uniref:Peroxidase n=1 Tax=Halocaridina rubra TaxID=373956 RepID=A0AAN8XBP7_HALRR